MPEESETIFALASGAGVAGVAVIRVSGPGADACLLEITARELPRARYATLRRLYDRAGELLDEAIVLRFPAGGSYTGEAVVELHCHGGLATVRGVLERLEGTDGCRLARPGEFTYRALEAGRMNLAEIEALGDLLSAETEAQRRQAIGGYVGGLHTNIEQWRRELVRALAAVEATIDWADEEVPENVQPEVFEGLARLREDIGAELRGFGAAERLRSGFDVALVGAPNAGKSTFLNALAGREAALTSAIPGTTRDVIELRYDLEGLPVVFLDMAGLRDSDEEIEALGIRRACERARGAAIRVFLVAPDAPLPAIAEKLVENDDFVVRSKADLALENGAPSGRTGRKLSAVTGEGIEDFLGELRNRLAAQAGEAGTVGRLRQKRILLDVVERTELALASSEPEIVAENIRSAVREMDRLTGLNAVEEVLGEVFSSFCLGK